MQELTKFQISLLLNLVETRIELEYSKNEALSLNSEEDEYLTELEEVKLRLIENRK